MLISDTSSLSRCDYRGVRDRAVCIWGPQPIVERRLVNAFVERVTQRFMKGLGDVPILLAALLRLFIIGISISMAAMTASVFCDFEQN
jgi:hypothetical protein